MFRDMRRQKQALTKEECIKVLTEQTRGVLSVQGDDGYPYGVPINHYYNPDDGHLYFHGGLTGHRVDAVRANDKASFCCYDEGFRTPGDWALNVKSVILFGRLKIVEDREKTLDISRKLCYKFTDDESYIAYEIEHSGASTLLMEFIPEHMTGKLVNEK